MSMENSLNSFFLTPVVWALCVCGWYIHFQLFKQSCTEFAQYHFIHLFSSLAHCHHGTSQHCLMNFTLLLMEEQFGWMWPITLMTKRLLSLILLRNMADLHI